MAYDEDAVKAISSAYTQVIFQFSHPQANQTGTTLEPTAVSTPEPTAASTPEAKAVSSKLGLRCKEKAHSMVG